jgi:hypothetical protein
MDAKMWAGPRPNAMQFCELALRFGQQPLKLRARAAVDVAAKQALEPRDVLLDYETPGRVHPAAP